MQTRSRAAEDRSLLRRPASQVLESLEPRALLASTTLSGGLLSVVLDNGRNNSLSVDNNVGGTAYLVTINGQSQTIDKTKVERIKVTGGDRADTLTISSSITRPTTLIGNAGNDTIRGGSGTDSILGGDGNDLIYGRGGNDSLFGGAGNDTMYAGTGDDSLVGEAGDDSLYGEDGNDHLDGGTGTDRLDGGNGTDVGTAGETLVSIEKRDSATNGTPTNGTPNNGSSGSGSGTVVSVSSGVLQAVLSKNQANRIYIRSDTSGANYLVTVNNAQQTVAKNGIVAIKIVGGDKGDNLDVSSTVTIPAIIEAGAGNDTIKGGSGPDRILAGGGSDIVESRGGNDTVVGGLGNDSIRGGGGNDIIFGDDGNDSLFGDSGNDAIDGGAGTDLIDGGSGTDTASGGETHLSIEKKVASIAPSNGGGSTGGGSSGGSTGGGTTGGSTGGGTTGGSTGGGASSGGQQTVGGAPINGTVSPGGSYPANNGAVQPTAVLVAQTVALPAGQALHVHALDSVLRRGTPLTARFEWDFGDPSSPYNRLVGFNAAHVYDQPGTYTVSLRVFNEAGGIDSVSKTITVTPSNRRFIYVSNSGSDFNDGSTSSKPVKSWSKAASLLKTYKNDVEVLFNRGDSWTATESLIASGSNIRIGAYGSGAAPKVIWAGSKNRNSSIRTDPTARFVTIEGLAFDSIWNSTNGDQTGMPIAIKPSGTAITVRGNLFLNVGFAVNANGKPTGLLVQDNDAPLVTGLRDYFLWAAGEQIVALGNTVANVTREHVVRVSEATRLLFSYNDFTNLDRRSVDRYDDAKGALVIQEGSYAYAAHNRLNGPAGVGPLGGSNGLNNIAARFRYAVIESNKIEKYSFELKHGAEHTMIRSNVIVVNDGPAINIDGFSGQYQRGVVNGQFINNTVINNGRKGNFLRLNGSATGLRVIGNLYVAPNLYIGEYGTSAIYVKQNTLDSFDRISNNIWPNATIHWWARGGVHWVSTGTTSDGYKTPAQWEAYAQVVGDHYSNVPIDASFKPASGSLAVVKQEPIVAGVFVDFYGRYRFGSSTIGAVQA